jgi:hypothetical protein
MLASSRVLLTANMLRMRRISERLDRIEDDAEMRDSIRLAG